MLRHYDDMGLLKPAHGDQFVDQFTDYRFNWQSCLAIELATPCGYLQSSTHQIP
jgi:hypothetical protein